MGPYSGTDPRPEVSKCPPPPNHPPPPPTYLLEEALRARGPGSKPAQPFFISIFPTCPSPLLILLLLTQPGASSAPQGGSLPPLANFDSHPPEAPPWPCSSNPRLRQLPPCFMKSWLRLLRLLLGELCVETSCDVCEVDSETWIAQGLSQRPHLELPPGREQQEGAVLGWPTHGRNPPLAGREPLEQVDQTLSVLSRDDVQHSKADGLKAHADTTPLLPEPPPQRRHMGSPIQEQS